MSIVSTCTNCPITVGRVQALSAGALGGVAFNVSGDRVTIVGAIYADSVTDSKTLRAQLRGHDDVIPVTWAADPTVDGFYRVLSAAVSMRGASLRHGVFDVSIDLERVDNFAGPLFEAAMVGATLTNGLGITGAPWHSFPDGSPQNAGSNALATTAYQRPVYGPTGASGYMRMLFYSSFVPIPRWRMPPTDFYWGAATIERTDGTTYRPITGLQQESDEPTEYRLQNGMVRCRFYNAGGEQNIGVSHFDGTQWETEKAYRLEANGSYVLLDWTRISVLQDKPESVTVRLQVRPIGLLEGIINVDFTLRRGDRWVRVYLTSQTARTWKLIRDSAEAATSITGGLRATANDADGNRYMLASATATSKDLANGALTLPVAGTSVGWGIGSEIGGSGAIVPDAATGARGMIEQYFAAQSETMNVAGR